MPNVPDQVPPELVWDHSYEAFLGEFDDPFEAAGRLHGGPGAIRATNATYGAPAWIPTRHELIGEAFFLAVRRQSGENIPIVNCDT